MRQLNIRLTANFEMDLKLFMELREINTKSEAIRLAVREGVQRHQIVETNMDYTNWLGLAIKSPTNEKNKFISDDDLWN